MFGVVVFDGHVIDLYVTFPFCSKLMVGVRLFLSFGLLLPPPPPQDPSANAADALQPEAYCGSVNTPFSTGSIILCLF
jgi:hypothetical protein